MNLYSDYKNIWRACNNTLDTLYPYIDKYEWYMDASGNIVVTNTDEKEVPAFCCHLDTVHKKAPEIEHINGILIAFNNTGVGGDDKCGIIACLELLKKVKCKCIFFREEERGCIGSKCFDTETLKDNLFLIEIDRKGNRDLIFKSGSETLCSENFASAVKETFTGYKEAWGIMTDVNVLGKAEINMMNISSGYYNPHSEKEYVVLKDLKKTILLLEAFAKKYKTKEKYVRIVEKPKKEKEVKKDYTFNGITWGHRIEQEDDSLLDYMRNLNGYDEGDDYSGY